jgi:hypothetical protein
MIGMQKNKILKIFFTFFLLVFIYLSGCTESSVNKQLKTIEINGMFEIINIDNRQQPIKLVVTGMDCLITVSRNTELVEVILDGDNNVVRVSSFHTFNKTINDVSSRIEYYE